MLVDPWGVDVGHLVSPYRSRVEPRRPALQVQERTGIGGYSHRVMRITRPWDAGVSLGGFGGVRAAQVGARNDKGAPARSGRSAVPLGKVTHLCPLPSSEPNSSSSISARCKRSRASTSRCRRATCSAARAQRRGQDDRRPHPHHPARPDGRSRRGRRARRRTRRRGAAVPDRAGRTERGRRREPHRPREPRDGRPPLPPARQDEARAPRRRGARAVRPAEAARPPGQDLLGRHAAATRPRGEPRRPPRHPVPRRADDRPRSSQPHRCLGVHPRAAERGHDACCSRRSTSKRPTSWPTASRSSTSARVIAEGTSDELKDRIGGEVLEIHVEQRDDVSRVRRACSRASAPARGQRRRRRSGAIRLPVGNEGPAALLDSVRRLDETRHRARRHRLAPSHARRRVPVAHGPRGRGRHRAGEPTTRRRRAPGPPSQEGEDEPVVQSPSRSRAPSNIAHRLRLAISDGIARRPAQPRHAHAGADRARLRARAARDVRAAVPVHLREPVRRSCSAASTTCCSSCRASSCRTRSSDPRRRRSARRRPQEGHHRPVPIAADGSVGGPRRPHDRPTSRRTCCS